MKAYLGTKQKYNYNHMHHEQTCIPISICKYKWILHGENESQSAKVRFHEPIILLEKENHQFFFSVAQKKRLLNYTASQKNGLHQ